MSFPSKRLVGAFTRQPDDKMMSHWMNSGVMK